MLVGHVARLVKKPEVQRGPPAVRRPLSRSRCTGAYCHVVLLRAGCAVRATLGFRYGYLNAWELYCGSAEGRKKVNAANSPRLKRLEGETG